MINKQFPPSYDVEQTIKYHTTSFDDLKRFMQSRGLLNAGQSKEQIAEFAVNILFEHQDYIFLRNLAQGAETATNISGFTVRSLQMPISIEELRDDIMNLRVQLSKQETEAIKKGAPIQKLSTPQIESNIIKMRFEYQRVIPGRVELMQRVDSNVAFTIEPNSPIQWRVVCYPQANQDVKKVELLFKKLGGGVYEPFTISLEWFTQRQRIQFFDNILEYYTTHNEWRFQRVIEITIRQHSDEQYIIIGEENEVGTLLGPIRITL